MTTVVGTAGVVGFSPGPLPGTLPTVNGVASYGTTLFITVPNGILKATGLP